MEYFDYIIYSKSLDRYYVGHSQDLEDRMSRHNSGRSKYTKTAKDWEVKYTERYFTRSEAINRERILKGRKAGNILSFWSGRMLARAFRRRSERPLVLPIAIGTVFSTET